VKKTILAVALVVFFVMALAVPAFAQNMTHTKTAEIDGTIDWEIQAGHLCNTGAELKSTIMGAGQLSKTMTTAQVKGKITVSDVNDFVAGATNLAVISVIELCAPPKFTYDDADGITAVVAPWAMYGHGSQPYVFGPHGFGEFGSESMESFSTYGDWDPVSKQIWAVHVNADPGFSGNLHQDFEAAYGPFAGILEANADGAYVAPTNAWGWNPVTLRPVVGLTFVGDYFNIEQHARTSMGAVQRFIDISSPWSGAYVYEDMTVVGKSEINEAFSMVNLGPGADVPGLWWDLF